MVLKSFLFVFISLGLLRGAWAQNETSRRNNSVLEVEWYPPETEKGSSPDRARVIISGRTYPFSFVRVDGDTVTVIGPSSNAPKLPEGERELRFHCRAYSQPNIRSSPLGILQKGEKVRIQEYSSSWYKVNLPNGVGYVSQPCFTPLNPTSGGPVASQKIESRETRANAEGFFELPMDLPQGLTQMPVLVITPEHAQKTFLISFDVNVVKEDIKMNAQISHNKPPAAAKKIRIWVGSGLTYQSDSQTTTGFTDLAFHTVQAPGTVARGGYWGDRWGVDLYFRDAPGKIEADPPLQVQSGSYHWRTMEAKGLYQFTRGQNSRMMGLPSQWQLRFGLQDHQIPYFDIDNTNTITIRDQSILMATLGIGLLLAQEQQWSYEFALSYLSPLSASGSFSVSSPFAYEAQIGAAYKFAANWRIGIFSYTKSLAYSYQFQNAGITKTGRQSLLDSTCDLRLGLEF